MSRDIAITQFPQFLNYALSSDPHNLYMRTALFRTMCVLSKYNVARSKRNFQIFVFKKINIHHEGHKGHEEKQRKL